MKKTSCLVLASSLLLGSMSASSLADVSSSANFIQISGGDRYETSVELSKASYPDKSKSVVIASGELFPDALAGGTLASIVDGPLLLTTKSGLPTNVKNELNRLNPKSVYILGGKNTISENVEKEIKNTFDNVYRIEGADRYETSIKIAEKVRELDKTSKKSIFVNGINFADALSAGALGAKLKAPLILTNGKDIPKSIEKVSNITDTANNVIVGGVSSVNIPAIKAERLSGTDRYGTSAALATKYFAKSENIVLASGKDYPDGLSSISLFKKYQMPILLSDKMALPTSISKYLKDNDSKLGVIVGGSNSIADSVRNDVKAIVESNKFKWKKPEFVDKLEAGSEPQTIRIRLNQSYDAPGMIEIYKLDKDGKLPSEATLSGGFNKNNAVGQIVDFKNVIILKKGDKFVARVVSKDDKKVFSDFTDPVTVSEDIPSAGKLISSLSGLTVELSKSESESDSTIIAALNNKIKSLNLDTNYEVTLGNSITDKVGGNTTVLGNIEVTAKSKKDSNDVKTSKISFRVNVVTNDVMDGSITMAEDNALAGANGKIVNDKDRTISFIATFPKSGTPNASNLDNPTIEARFNNSSDSNVVLPTVSDLSKDYTGTSVRYTGKLTVKQNHGAGTITITVKTGIDKAKTASGNIEVINNEVKNLKTTDLNGSEDKTSFEISALNVDQNITVKPEYISPKDQLKKEDLKATVEKVEMIDGATPSEIPGKITVNADLDGNDKYKLTVKDTNGNDVGSHKITIKLVYQDGNIKKEKTIYFTYTKK